MAGRKGARATLADVTRTPTLRFSALAAICILSVVSRPQALGSPGARPDEAVPPDEAWLDLSAATISASPGLPATLGAVLPHGRAPIAIGWPPPSSGDWLVLGLPARDPAALEVGRALGLLDEPEDLDGGYRLFAWRDGKRAMAVVLGHDPAALHAARFEFDGRAGRSEISPTDVTHPPAEAHVGLVPGRRADAPLLPWRGYLAEGALERADWLHLAGERVNRIWFDVAHVPLPDAKAMAAVAAGYGIELVPCANVGRGDAPAIAAAAALAARYAIATGAREVAFDGRVSVGDTAAPEVAKQWPNVVLEIEAAFERACLAASSPTGAHSIERLLVVPPYFDSLAPAATLGRRWPVSPVLLPSSHSRSQAAIHVNARHAGSIWIDEAAAGTAVLAHALPHAEGLDPAHLAAEGAYGVLVPGAPRGAAPLLGRAWTGLAPPDACGRLAEALPPGMGLRDTRGAIDGAKAAALESLLRGALRTQGATGRLVADRFAAWCGAAPANEERTIAPLVPARTALDDHMGEPTWRFAAAMPAVAEWSGGRVQAWVVGNGSALVLGLQGTGEVPPIDIATELPGARVEIRPDRVRVRRPTVFGGTAGRERRVAGSAGGRWTLEVLLDRALLGTPACAGTTHRLAWRVAGEADPREIATHILVLP